MEASPSKAATPSDSLTFRPSGGVIMERAPSGAMQPAHPPAPESDTATRGSVHGSVPPHGAAHHQRTASAGSAAGHRSVHYRGFSADSGRGAPPCAACAHWAAGLDAAGAWPLGIARTLVHVSALPPHPTYTLSSRPPPQAGGASTPAASHAHLSSTEHLMASRLHEFGDSRGIAAGTRLVACLPACLLPLPAWGLACWLGGSGAGSVLLPAGAAAAAAPCLASPRRRPAACLPSLACLPACTAAASAHHPSPPAACRRQWCLSLRPTIPLSRSCSA